MPPPPPSDHAAFHLHVLKNPFFVQQLSKDDPIPTEYINRLNDSSKGFFSITKTDEEVSVVGESDESDEKDDNPPAAWKCIKIAGPMDFGVTGVMCNFTTPLKHAAIPVFAVSTWDTDFILVPKEKLERAAASLEADGWIFATR